MHAAARRAEILAAADLEFANRGLAGARLEAIATRVGITHPRVVQMFGSKRSLFLEVVTAAYGKIEATFAGVERPTLISLGAAYRQLLHEEPSVGLVMLQSFAATADETIREAVRSRHIDLQLSIAQLTGADASQTRTFIATGLVMTVSTVLELPNQRADATWGAWILDLVAQPAEAERP
ncbi:MAG: TetR/AcrR family transcriptional regulator [Aeromicrobium sp.]